MWGSGGRGVVARADVAHLCRRAGFGASESEIDALSAKATLDALVDAVVDDPRNSGTVKVKPALPKGNHDPGYGGYVKVVQLGRWWLERMSAARFATANTAVPAPLREKMILFWHGLLVSSFLKPQLAAQNFSLANQHLLFRANALGDYETLLSAVSRDPAMLIYLDNWISERDFVNENYGRELLELFALGVGNYTQTEVVAAAKSGTGYTLDRSGRFLFKGGYHDTSIKSFFGFNANWDLTGVAGDSGGNNVVPYLCTGKQVEVSRYIGKLLFQYFAHFTPSASTLDDVAAGFRQSGRLSIKDAVKTILKHPDFWSATARNGKAKMPPEWVAVCGRALALTKFPKGRHGDDQISTATDAMGLFLFNQPSVFGWWRRPETRWIGYPAFAAKVDLLNVFANEALRSPRHRLYTLAGMTTADAVDTVFRWFLVDPATAGAAHTRAIAMLDELRTEHAGSYWEALNLFRFAALSPAVQVN